MNLKDEIKDELKEDLLEGIKKIMAESNAKEKKFRYPFGKKVGRSQKKKNYVTVVIMYENSIVDIKKYQIENQTIFHDMIPRLATFGHIFSDKKGNPWLFLENWSINPLNPLDNFNKSLTDGTNKKGFKIILDNMISQITEKKKMKMGKVLPWIIGIVIAGIIGYILMSGGGGA